MSTLQFYKRNTSNKPYLADDIGSYSLDFSIIGNLEMPGNPFSTLGSNKISPLPKGNSLVQSDGTESVSAV